MDLPLVVRAMWNLDGWTQHGPRIPNEESSVSAQSHQQVDVARYCLWDTILFSEQSCVSSHESRGSCFVNEKGGRQYGDEARNCDTSTTCTAGELHCINTSPYH